MAGLSRQGHATARRDAVDRSDAGARVAYEMSDGIPSSTSATGIGWERTPWHAAQRAAWDALRRAE